MFLLRLVCAWCSVQNAMCIMLEVHFMQWSILWTWYYFFTSQHLSSTTEPNVTERYNCSRITNVTKTTINMNFYDQFVCNFVSKNIFSSLLFFSPHSFSFTCSLAQCHPDGTVYLKISLNIVTSTQIQSKPQIEKHCQMPSVLLIFLFVGFPLTPYPFQRLCTSLCPLLSIQIDFSCNKFCVQHRAPFC